VSRPSAERRSRTEREPGPSATTREAQQGCRPRSVVSPLGPGSRCARPGHECAKSRRAKRTVGLIPIHDVKQRSVIRSRGARCCARVCASLSQVPSLLRPPASPRGFGASGRRDSSNSVPPMRGGWSADRRTHSFGRACDARPPCPGATGTSLGAPPWRFSDADPRSRLPAVEPEPQRLPAPGINARRSGSGPPALRFAPQRGTPLLAPSFRIVSRKRPL
jgi:hypothetical protein